MSAPRLLEELLRLGADPNPPATSMMIEDAEGRLGTRFPNFDAVTYAYCGDPTSKDLGRFFGDQSGEVAWCAADSFSHFVEVFLAHHDDMLINCGQSDGG